MSKRGLDKTLSLLLEKTGSGLSSVISGIEDQFEVDHWVPVKDYFSVSQLFYCPRKAFLARLGAPKRDDFSSCFKMSVGTDLHTYIQNSMESNLSGYGFREFELTSTSLSVIGHIDGAIISEGKLVEIKTVSSHMAMSVRRRGMPDYYLGQANLYAYLWNRKYKRKLDKIWFVVLCRDSMDFINLDPVPIDNSIQRKTAKLLKQYCNMWESGIFPERKSKNCSDCSLNSICGKSDKIRDFIVGGKYRT